MNVNDWVEFGADQRLGRIESVTHGTFLIQHWVESACGTLVSVGTPTRIQRLDARLCPDPIVAVGDGFMYADATAAVPAHIITAPSLLGCCPRMGLVVPDPGRSKTLQGSRGRN